VILITFPLPMRGTCANNHARSDYHSLAAGSPAGSPGANAGAGRGAGEREGIGYEMVFPNAEEGLQ
jgi:hypothetical protein